MKKERNEWGERKNQNENQGTEDQVVRGMKENHSGVERKKIVQMGMELGV